VPFRLALQQAYAEHQRLAPQAAPAGVAFLRARQITFQRIAFSTSAFPRGGEFSIDVDN
jgi:hypothetical protein